MPIPNGYFRLHKQSPPSIFAQEGGLHQPSIFYSILLSCAVFSRRTQQPE